MVLGWRASATSCFHAACTRGHGFVAQIPGEPRAARTVGKARPKTDRTPRCFSFPLSLVPCPLSLVPFSLFPFPFPLSLSLSPYFSSRTQMLRKLIGGLGSPCDCSLIGAASYFL